MFVNPGEAEVFVSYASEDRGRVMEIVEQLDNSGISYWLDRVQLEGASHWAHEIVCGINGCKVLLLVVSDASMRSWAVKQEIQLAGERQKVLLPLLLSRPHYPEQIEFFLAGRQWIEVGQRPAEQWLPALLRALRKVGLGEARAPASRGLGAVPEAEEAPPPSWGLDELRKLGRLTDQLWPMDATAPTARRPRRGRTRGMGEAQGDVQHVYRLGSKVRLMLDSDRPGHLLLLDQGPEGKLYCLCPSDFAPSTAVVVGPNVYPQEEARYDSFVLTGVPGREELLAIISAEPLPLDWMPTDRRSPARVLSEADVQQLLAVLTNLPGRSWAALSTYFDVVA